MKEKARVTEYEEAISALKAEKVKTEIALKNATFSKGLLEKELETKRWKDTVREGDMKIQNKQLQLKLAER